MNEQVPVADLFAGPGGLGEGFASLNDFFRIELSAECSPPAHKTLKLRAFKRALEANGESLDDYYRYVHGQSKMPFSAATRGAWHHAEQEALCVTLGQENDDKLFTNALDQRQFDSANGVMVGGPPCQAYSVVGRARNRGIAEYVPENDNRHFLYREYLKLIQHYRPAVFVMENVKGILTSRVGGKRIFNQILVDLVDPDSALERAPNGPGYRIHSLVDPDIVFRAGDDPETIRGESFLVRSEDHGVPQTRHRVFLVGVRNDISANPEVLRPLPAVTTGQAIDDLPALRSGLSRKDSDEGWLDSVRAQVRQLAPEARSAGQRDIAERLEATISGLRRRHSLSRGGLRYPKMKSPTLPAQPDLADWWDDPRLEVLLNHEARSHMPSDLGRYMYASTFAELHGRSPSGSGDFGLPSLAPNHANWMSGKFADRFRVQLRNEPAKTITSHISKDGHYYIHHDPSQCRALTVREAARIQTFPDNYFFEGNRTEQYTQVGNAVPPWLARQIAEIVRGVLIAHSGHASCGHLQPRPEPAGTIA
ncbi:DNA cytosine methyltransferase [Thioalkalivibrio sp. ALMg3]|uniref:DNA cytosine methyltransferase n=1 Tax=Thioalkalivibrio sp. ALMg3 TaxID=1158163 RepID=UPI00035F59E0|nr:DNA cytosine methyltransferase [Thioalkalivibrio sp. ALMg3]